MSAESRLVEAWLEKADHDLGTAKLTLEHRPGYADVICFHCQQAAEKYLKAYLVFLGVPFAKTHSLTYLLDLISEHAEVSKEFYALAEELQAFAIEVRYPEVPSPSREEARIAYENACSIRDFVLERIGKPRMG